MDPETPFRLVLAAAFISMCCIGGYHRLRAHSGEPLDRRQEGWIILIGLRLVALLAMFVFIAYLLAPSSVAWSQLPLPVVLRWLGVPIGLASMLLFLWTFRTLGRNLTDTVVTRREHNLVTCGPYRYARHPFYVAFALSYIGTSLVMANLAIAILGTIVLVLLVLRTPIEEANLIARFGEEYRAYMQATPRFIPRFGKRA